MLLHLQILIYGYFQWRQHPLKTRHFNHSSIKCGLPWKYLFGFKFKIISWTTLSTKSREKGQVMTTRRIEAKVKSQVNTLGASSHICSCSIVSESILASSSFTHRYLSKNFFQYLSSFKIIIKQKHKVNYHWTTIFALICSGVIFLILLLSVDNRVNNIFNSTVSTLYQY